MRTNLHHASIFTGCLLGTALGDARGLAYEGLSRRTMQARFPRRAQAKHYHFLFGYGMCSDDTEHAFMTGQALLASHAHSADKIPQFQKNLAWRLRFWLLGLPAGIGAATLRSIVKLWLGYSPQSSGVYSAGNGPAMRAPLLGLWSQGDGDLLRRLVKASSQITHTDPEAESGALWLAWCAHYAATEKQVSLASFSDALEAAGLLQDTHIAQHWLVLSASLAQGQTTLEFANMLGCTQGVSGYMWHSVPVVLHTFLSHPDDFDAAINAIIDCGGDTDSTAAMVGALVGIRVGENGMADYWQQRLIEWPTSLKKIKQLALRLTQAQCLQTPVAPLPNWPWTWLALLLRNGVFLCAVLLHGFIRLLPRS